MCKHRDFDIQEIANQIAIDYFTHHSQLPDPPEIVHDCENLWTNVAPYLQAGVITQQLIEWIAPCDECLRQLDVHLRCSKKQREYMLTHRHDRFGKDRRKMAALFKRQIERAEVLLDLALQIIPDRMYVPRQVAEQ